MTEIHKKTDSAVLLMVTLMLAIIAFGAGIVAGRMLLRGNRRAGEKSVTPVQDRTSTRKLAACRHELATLPKATTTSAPPVALENAASDGVDPSVKVELLKDELIQHDIEEVMVRADICNHSQGYLHFMMFLPNKPETCIAKEEIADLLEDSYEVCADLTMDTKVYFDIMELPEKDRNRIAGGFNHYSRKQKEDYVTWRKIVLDKCLKETGQLDE
jgi:hypothetical protein